MYEETASEPTITFTLVCTSTFSYTNIIHRSVVRFCIAFAIRHFCSHEVPLLFPPIHSLSFAESDPEGIPSCSISSIFFHRKRDGRTNDRKPSSFDPFTRRWFISSWQMLPPPPSIAIDITIASSTSEDSHRRIGSFRVRQRRLVIQKSSEDYVTGGAALSSLFDGNLGSTFCR